MARVGEPILYYEMAGEGPTVVLIHDGQMHRRMWDGQFDRLVRRYRVVRYDVRGYGKSEPAVRPYANVDDLRDLIGFLMISATRCASFHRMEMIA